MAGRKLAVNTTVAGVTYDAGTVPPADVAKLIDNPKAWGKDSEPEAADGQASSDAKASK